jgi:hypothetical protein
VVLALKPLMFALTFGVVLPLKLWLAVAEL